MFSDVKLQDAPSVMRDDEEAIKNTERQRWHREEIHRRYDFAMIAQKGHPSFRWLRISGRLAHPSQNRSLGDVEAEHLQLAVNAWRSPGSILGHHAENEFAQLHAYRSSSGVYPMPREPRPIEPEADSMPTDNSLGLNEDQLWLAKMAICYRVRRMN